MAKVDARLRELQFLARLDREGPITIAKPYDESPERQMIVSLLHDGYLNGIDSIAFRHDGAPVAMALAVHSDDWKHAIGALLSQLPQPPQVELRISHKGRVRLSELEQQLQTGRDRDDTGILWTKRHLVTDLAIAIVSADKDAPLSVAFLDMNGLTGINNTHGHAAGDEALQAFFQAAVATLGQSGEAYRYGGDEVVVLLPGVDDEPAGKLLDSFVRQLGKDVLVLGETKATTRLTASCGCVSTTNPNEDAETLIKRADKLLYRAKPRSGQAKLHTGRVSAFAVGDGEAKTYAPGDGETADAE